MLDARHGVTVEWLASEIQVKYFYARILLDKHVEVGYATVDENGQYALTSAGKIFVDEKLKSEQAVVDAYHSGETMPAIAERTGRSFSVVRGLLVASGVTRRTSHESRRAGQSRERG
jgi:hypothetical protein